MANLCVNTIYFCAENRELLLELFNKIRSCYDSMPANNIYEYYCESNCFNYDYERSAA